MSKTVDLKEEISRDDATWKGKMVLEQARSQMKSLTLKGGWGHLSLGNRREDEENG